jgi:superfamily II DNA helicase RecQ
VFTFIHLFIYSIVSDVRKAVREDGYRPFSHLMEMTHFLTALIRNTTHMPRITWNDDAGEEMVFDGYLITTTSFRVMYHKLLSDTKKMLLDDVLLGLELPDLHHDHIHDELNNSEPHYSFISDKRNTFHNHANFLLSAMLEDNRHKDRFHDCEHTNETSGIAWKTAAVMKWMKICENTIGNLFALAHFGSGQPARGTELATFAPENTTTQLRNVYWYRGFLNLVAMYNKTQAKSQRPRVIGRSLPPVVAELFVYWLALVIPTLDIIWTCLSTARTLDPARFRCRLFTGLTGNFNTDDFSAILSSLSGEPVVDLGMGRAMGIADIQHFLIGLMRKHCRGIRDRNFTEEYFDEQSGHGGDAADNYAITTSSILNESEDHLDKFVELSKLQHRVLFPDTLQVESNSDARILPMAKVDDNKLSAMIDARISSYLDPLASKMTTLLAPGMKKNIVDAVASLLPITPPGAAIGAMPSRRDVNAPIAAGAGLVDVSQVDVHPARLAELYAVMGKDAVFKSTYQACAVELSARRDKDLICILGTGEGKSLIFMLCAANAEEVNLTTIVIVPLIALLKDLVSRLRKRRIRVLEWSTTVSHYHAQVTILSTEAAATKQFLSYFLTGCQSKKIARVVLDEIHALLTEKHYRPLLACINQLRQGTVQFLGLSATIPESAVAKIMALMHFLPGNTLIIRAPTIRKEIAYSVFEIASPWGYGPSEALYRDDNGQLLKLMDYIKKFLNDFRSPTERALVFCLSRTDAEQVAVALGCQFYHAGLEEAERKSVIDLWRDGSANTLAMTTEPHTGNGRKALAATTALGAGFDHPEIGLVVHYKKPRNLINFAQESGRAGRQLKIAYSTVFWDPKQKDQGLAPDQDDIGVAGMQEYVSTSTCRRICLGRHLDDTVYKTCLQDGTMVLCDLCKKKLRDVPVVSEQSYHIHRLTDTIFIRDQCPARIPFMLGLYEL